MNPSVLLAELRYKRLLRRMAGPRLLRAFADAYPHAFFVEIGANDGVQHDHLRSIILSRSWSGILVEPVPYVFERLRSNYAGIDRVILENAAIADCDATAPFYYLARATEEERGLLPQWYDGIGSFSREAVLSHAPHIPDIDQRLVRADIPCLTFDSLLRRHEAPRVDLVVIDTEGYDWEIIRHIDLRTHRPRLLVYEHFHLTSEDRQRCRHHVAEQGYAIKEEGFDTFCLSHDCDERLRRRWARMRPAVAGVSAFDKPAG
jgi:FkbM family methyltransferase